MKKILSLLGFLLAIVAVTFATTFPEQIPYIGEFLTGSHCIALAVIAPWFVMTGTEKAFKTLSGDEYEALDDEQKSQYETALLRHNTEKEAAIKSELSRLQVDSTANKDLIKQLKDQLDAMNKDIPAMLIALKAQGTELTKLKNTGAISKDTFETRLKAAFDATADQRLAISKNASRTFAFEIKAQTYGDIIDGSDVFTTTRTGVIDIAYEAPKLRQLFATIPLSTETYRYMQQKTVVRDAKKVAKCTAPSTNTKETLEVVSVGTKIIADIIPFCRDFIDDYPFMASRIDKLIRESLETKIEQQLLLGTGLGEELESINNVSSTFDKDNADAVVKPIQMANLIDLLGAMKMQISKISKGRDKADTIIMTDELFFSDIDCLKDTTGNYLSKDIAVIGGVVYIKGMRVVTSGLIDADTVYVFDSRKGEILDRKTLNIEVNFSDADDWQKRFGKLMGYVNMNFIVPNEYHNAFMKCEAVAVTIAAITAI